MAAKQEFLLFSGTSHQGLAQEMADCLGVNLGKVLIERFPDGELNVRVLQSVRGRDIFLLQTIALDPDRYLMELLLLVDALKRASANSINVVIPYFGYARQDRKDQPRVPITAKLVANLLSCAGVDHLLTVDLHAGQIQGFFDIPVDHLQAISAIIPAFNKLGWKPEVVVAPDIGSVKLARAYATALGAEFAMIDKYRNSPEEVKVALLVGDVQGKNVLLADDLCSTAGTLVSAANVCQEKGAKRIFATVTHGLCVGQAVKNIEQSPIETLFMSNTIPETERLLGLNKQVVSIAPLLSQAIRCVLSGKSISSLI